MTWLADMKVCKKGTSAAFAHSRRLGTLDTNLGELLVVLRANLGGQQARKSQG